MLRDRFMGAVIGLCVGEAFGAQFESKAASMVQMKIQENGFVFTGDKRGKLQPGEWTDDAGQFIALMNSFNVTHGFEPLDAAGCLTGWFKHQPKRVGMHTAEIVRHLRVDLGDYPFLGRDAWIRSSGVKAGNGCMARCLVPGLFYCHDLEKMIEATIGTATITHFDPRCVESCVILNYFMMECLNSRFSISSLDYAEAFLQSIRQSESYTDYMAGYDPNSLMDYTNFSPYQSYNDDRDAVIDGLRTAKKNRFSELHSSGYCVHTLTLALSAMLQSKSFEEGLIMAVGAGGDTDTNGAITGALLGAMYGLSGIPSPIKSSLRKYPLIASQAEQMLSAAEKAEARDLQGKRSPHQPPPPMA